MCKEKRSLLLIGGTGVLSGAVVAEALRQGIDVTIITRGNRTVPEGVTSLICDKYDYAKLSTLITEKYDAVIDFLCFSLDEIERSFKFYSKITTQFFFISSCAVYDSRVGGVIAEDAPKVLPMWSYSVSKWAAEQKLRELARVSSCSYTIIRPAVTYDDTRVPYGISPQYGCHWTLCARIMAGKPIITWNNGKNFRNMLRVEDFAVGVVGLIGNMMAYNEAFNVCGDETPTWGDVLSVVERYLNKKAVVVDIPSDFYAKQIPYRAGELLGGRAISSINANDKIKAAVPEFAQTISIREGIYKTLDAYKANNYEKGIDWKFDAETDKTIMAWCEANSIPSDKYKLGFIDYLGTATWYDRYVYFDVVKRDTLLGRIMRIVKRTFQITLRAFRRK